MSSNEPIPISIDYLRRNMRTILNRVAGGETFVLTDTRVPAAILGPIPKIPNQQTGCDK